MNIQQGKLTALFLILAMILAGPGCSRDDDHSRHDHDTGHAEEIDHTGHDHDTDHDDHDSPAVALESDHDDCDDHGDQADHDDETLLHLSVDEQRLIGLELAVAAEVPISRNIELPGEIELNADGLAHIVPRVAGAVREVRVGLGDKVRAGEVLAILDSRELADARAEFLSARETLELMQARYDREQDLHGKGISSEEELLEARGALSEVTIALRSARQKLLALGLDTTELAVQNADFTRYPLVAPISGVVIEKHITLGEALEADTEAFTISDLGTVWGRIDIYQQDLPLVREGQQVRFYTDADHLLATGVIDFITPMLGARTRTASARVVLDNPDGELRPGTFITALVAVGETGLVVSVPEAALQMLDGETILFVPEADGFAARPVTTGRRSHGLVEIGSGLHVGDSYVNHGAFALKAKLITSNLDPHAGHGH
jgi:membrane fusion protein, heavy metal efflux system